MPCYTYRCKACLQNYQAVHSIYTKLFDCELCGTMDSLERIPHVPFTISSNETTNKPGEIVKEHIEETREAIKEEKRNMMREIE